MKKIIFILYGLALPAAGKAQSLPTIPYVGPITPGSLVGYLRTIGNFLLVAGVIISVIFLAISGITWMTAGADATQANKAKERFKWALVGTLVLFSIGLILNTMGALGTGTFFG